MEEEEEEKDEANMLFYHSSFQWDAGVRNEGRSKGGVGGRRGEEKGGKKDEEERSDRERKRIIWKPSKAMIRNVYR